MVGTLIRVVRDDLCCQELMQLLSFRVLAAPSCFVSFHGKHYYFPAAHRRYDLAVSVCRRPVVVVVVGVVVVVVVVVGVVGVGVL